MIRQYSHLLVSVLLFLPECYSFLSSASSGSSSSSSQHRNPSWSFLHVKQQSVIDFQESTTLQQRRHPHQQQRYSQFRSRNSTLTDMEVMVAQLAESTQRTHRNLRHSISCGDGATSDRVCFNTPGRQDNEDGDSIRRKHNMDSATTAVRTEKRRKESQHWVVLSNDSTVLYLDTTTTTQRGSPQESPRTVAESAFLGKCIHPMMETRQSAVELSTLLDIPLRSAETMIRKVPSLATTDLLGKIASRCVEMSILLRITPRELAAVVKRFPNLLTLKPKKLEKKLMQLDTLLSCDGDDHDDDCSLDNRSQVSERTIAIVKRVPRLLAYDVSGTLSKHVTQLSTLLGLDNDKATMKKILRRCPELLMYRVKHNLLPKLITLHTLFDASTLDVVKKEPRLLLYSVEDSLLPKVQSWKDRVEDKAQFHQLLCRYPSLLLYSRGAAARLEYYTHVNAGRKPDATDARQLIMTSKKVVETWEPSFLTGSVSKRGRPRRGETVKEAAARRRGRMITNTAVQLSYREWLESNLVDDLSDVQLCVAELGSLERQFGALR